MKQNPDQNKINKAQNHLQDRTKKLQDLQSAVKKNS